MFTRRDAVRMFSVGAPGALLARGARASSTASLVTDPQFRANFANFREPLTKYVPQGNDPTRPAVWAINQSNGLDSDPWGRFSGFRLISSGEQLMNTNAHQLVRQVGQGIRLSTNGGAAYNGGCRSPGLGWLHLLVATDFLNIGPGASSDDKTFLSVGRQYNINLSLDFEVLNSVSTAPCAQLQSNPNQFLFTLLLAGIGANGRVEFPNSDYTNRFWYQIPIYDNRWRDSSQMVMKDQHGYPIFIDSSALFFRSTHDGGARSIRAG